MSNENNIQNFDSFFKEAFNSFEPTAPQGVFEAIQSQIGTAGASSGAAAGGAIAKASAWGISKIIIGAVATIAAATTVYIATQNNTATPTNNTPQNTTEQTSNAPSANNSTNTPQDIQENTDTENTAASELTGKAADNAAPSQTITPQNTKTQSTSAVWANPQTGDATADKNNKGNGDETSAKPSKTDTDLPKQEKTLVGVYLSNSNLCVNDVLNVTIADDITKNSYAVNFGDGTIGKTQKGKPTIHRYKTKGKYKIVATAINGTKESKEQWVEVNGVTAEFAAENIEKATFRFINKTQNAAHYTWFFGDNSEVSQQASPTHTYTSFEQKKYTVKLIAIDNMGCVDSFSTQVTQNYTYENLKPKLYNVFSPGADGRNDHYEIEIENEELYYLEILDKNGNKVFESDNKNITWDGRNMYTGEDCAAANYAVVFLYKIKGFEKQTLKRFVTLVR